MLLIYSDEILKPSLRLPTNIVEGIVNILETCPKFKEIFHFHPFADFYTLSRTAMFWL